MWPCPARCLLRAAGGHLRQQPSLSLSAGPAAMWPCPARCLLRAAGGHLRQQPSLSLSTSEPRSEIRKLARLRVVDNSPIGVEAMAEGRPPRVIHVYNKKMIATVGDKVLLAIKGQKRKGILVGCVKTPHPQRLVPRFDTNNVVLVDDAGTPLGTRIHVPIPNVIRDRLQRMSHKKAGDFTKLLSLATRFV